MIHIIWWLAVLIGGALFIGGFALACLLAAMGKQSRLEEEVFFNAINKKEEQDGN